MDSTHKRLLLDTVWLFLFRFYPGLNFFIKGNYNTGNFPLFFYATIANVTIAAKKRKQRENNASCDVLSTDGCTPGTAAGAAGERWRSLAPGSSGYNLWYRC